MAAISIKEFAMAIVSGMFLMIHSVHGQETDFTDLVSGEIVFTESEAGPEPEEFDPALFESLDPKTAEIVNLANLSCEQLAALGSYTAIYGPVLTIYELLYIDGFTPEDISLISASSNVRENKELSRPPLKNPSKYRHLLLTGISRRVERQEGYLKAAYTGTPEKYWFKYELKKGEMVRAAVVMEKDAGEAFGIPDLYGGFIHIRSKGVFSNLILGDFMVHCGAGVNLSLKSMFPGQKGTIFRNTRAVSGKFSTGETSFLRGICARAAFKNFSLSTFLSYRKRDGTLDTATNLISGFPASGLHRTPSEISCKKAVSELITGFSAEYRKGLAQAGFTAFYARYDPAVKLRTHASKTHTFAGDGQRFAGPYIRFRKEFIQFFGEFSSNLEGECRYMMALELFAGGNSQFAISYSKSTLGYTNNYGNAFLWGMKSNMEGIYAGFNTEIFPGVTAGGFVRIEKKPWITYQLEAPSTSLNSGLSFDISIGRDLKVQFRYRNILKNKAESEIFEYLRAPLEETRHEFRMKVKAFLSSSLVMVCSVDQVLVRSENTDIERGTLAYTEFSWQPSKTPVQLVARFCHFDTDSFVTRIYTYERDTRYAMSIPSYYGQGNRNYCLVRIIPSRLFRIEFRAGITRFWDRFEIGSGNEKINGNKKTDLKLVLISTF